MLVTLILLISATPSYSDIDIISYPICDYNHTKDPLIYHAFFLCPTTETQKQDQKL